MPPQYHYVYRITNLKLNKHYYGCRTSKVEPKFDLGIKYFSSSCDKDFQKLQKERPWEFKYKVVHEFATRTEALNFEIKLHNKFNVGVNENFYNKAKQTSLGFCTAGIHNPLSEDHKEKISKATKGKPKTEKHKNNMRKPRTEEHRKHISEGISGENHQYYNKHLSEDHKEKIRESCKGKPKSEEHCLNISKAKTGVKRTTPPWNKGLKTNKPAWNRGMKAITNFDENGKKVIIYV